MITLVANAVDMRILDAPKDVQLKIYELLSYFVEGFETTYSYRTKQWSGKDSFFNNKTQSCPAGFFPLIERQLQLLNVPYQIKRTPLPPILGPDLMTCQAKTGYPFQAKYAYQHETVERLLQFGQMIAMLATGSGKSLVAALAYFHIGRPTLFLTTRQVLAYQMKDRMEAMGERVGILGDSIWEPNPKGFNVAMSQTLAMHLKPFDERSARASLENEPLRDVNGNIRKDKRGNTLYTYSDTYKRNMKDPAKFREYQEAISHRLLQLRVEHEQKVEATKRLLERFEFVILEEAHEVSADGYYVVMRHCRNAHYRLALTATPFLKDSELANLRLMATSGPVGMQVTEKHLIDLGVLAKPYFQFVEIPKVPKLRVATWQDAYRLGIVENLARNKKVIERTKYGIRHHLPILILVLRKAHGNLLQEMLEGEGIRSQFIYGDSDAQERKLALSQLESRQLQVLIGTVILDVGVDIPAIGMIILAGGGKVEVNHRQRIGRGLRAKKTGPNQTYIVDFMDRSSRILERHSLQRRGIVEAIEGFRENILPPGKEFPIPEICAA